MRSFFPLLYTPMLDPATLAMLRTGPRGNPMRRLAVRARSTRVMRRARTDRQGRRVPAVLAPLLICTRVATGKRWPADHSTSRMRRARG